MDRDLGSPVAGLQVGVVLPAGSPQALVVDRSLMLEFHPSWRRHCPSWPVALLPLLLPPSVCM